ncbi:hypothetical protein BDEG_21349 [Batrachochytrium dendrobatidis JEL423]|uniref:Uncharacterized protein n=1 Tax=Batrachochytrium dendrobatidis (strain JEL423) TaxID=403673 RepID=A0A177WC97_BATDL|nr:hypothetical protein BDEG_21349 [Batrachochytrium dendrobatidis JEL423]
MPEKDDIDCQEMPELFHDYYGIKINKDYSGIDVKHPNDIEKHYSGKPKILFDNGNYQPKTGVFDMFEANTLWIRSIEQELGRDIEQNKTIAKYNVDGYDDKTNTVRVQRMLFSRLSFTSKDTLSYLSPNTSQYLTVHP